MRAAGIDAFGGEVHMLELAAPAPPGPDELVMFHAAGVGNWDELVRVGDWDAGGVTGGLAVQLAVARGATVVATAGPSSTARVRGYGARVVLDYHDPEWPARVRDASPGGRGVGAAVNAARGGAATTLQAVADHGRLATITGDPPPQERGVTVADVYVRADGSSLAALVTAIAEGVIRLHVGNTCPLTGAASALAGAVAGRASGASVLMLDRRPPAAEI
jgi:NADPH:quinone reductase-like Zn-dependent oxidoreductase